MAVITSQKENGNEKSNFGENHNPVVLVATNGRDWVRLGLSPLDGLGNLERGATIKCPHLDKIKSSDPGRGVSKALAGMLQAPRNTGSGLTVFSAKGHSSGSGGMRGLMEKFAKPWK